MDDPQATGHRRLLPDYDLEPSLVVGDSSTHKALSDPGRRRIVALLLERAATAKQLAHAIGRSPQTTTHHLTVLEEAGLVRVVRTAKVRATEQRWWGRTARLFIFRGDMSIRSSLDHRTAMLDEARAEMAAADQAGLHAEGAGSGGGATIRYARIPGDRADEWFQRLMALVDEFAEQPREGDRVHGLYLTVFPTAWAPLPDSLTGSDASDTPRAEASPQPEADG